eukprot:scaffold11057_cov66-Skeletonema_marinoi.AAC.5
MSTKRAFGSRHPAARPYLLLPTILLARLALRELTKKSTNQSVQWTGDGQHNDVRETPHSYQGNTSYIMRSNSNSKASILRMHRRRSCLSVHFDPSKAKRVQQGLCARAKSVLLAVAEHDTPFVLKIQVYLLPYNTP